MHGIPRAGINLTVTLQFFNDIVELIDLNRSVDEKAHVQTDKADDLNGIFHAEGIPNQDQLVDEGKNIEGKECGDRRGRIGFAMRRIGLQVFLKSYENISGEHC